MCEQNQTVQPSLYATAFRVCSVLYEQNPHVQLPLSYSSVQGAWQVAVNVVRPFSNM